MQPQNSKLQRFPSARESTSAYSSSCMRADHPGTLALKMVPKIAARGGKRVGNGLLSSRASPSSRSVLQRPNTSTAGVCHPVLISRRPENRMGNRWSPSKRLFNIHPHYCAIRTATPLLSYTYSLLISLETALTSLSTLVPQPGYNTAQLR